MRGYAVIFCWLCLLTVLVVSEAQELSELQKKANTNSRKKEPRRMIRGSANMPEDEQSRMLFLPEIPERKQRSDASKDNLKMGRAGETWRERLFPPTDAPTMAPSSKPSSSPTGEVDKKGYFEELDRPIRVACAGDSLTRGIIGFTSFANSYPSQLQQMLGDKYEVINYGVNSATAIRDLSVTYGIRPEFQASLKFQPDIYLLMLGTNDAKYWEAHGRKYRRDMEWLVNQVRTISRNSPVRIILAIPPWVKSNVFSIENQVLVDGVQPAVRNIATLEGLQVVDMYNVTVNQNDFFISDGLHLNQKGYRSLAAAWKLAMQCNDNGICEPGENCQTCPGDCYLGCS